MSYLNLFVNVFAASVLAELAWERLERACLEARALQEKREEPIFVVLPDCCRRRTPTEDRDEENEIGEIETESKSEQQGTDK